MGKHKVKNRLFAECLEYVDGIEGVEIDQEREVIEIDFKNLLTVFQDLELYDTIVYFYSRRGYRIAVKL